MDTPVSSTGQAYRVGDDKDGVDSRPKSHHSKFGQTYSVDSTILAVTNCAAPFLRLA